MGTPRMMIILFGAAAIVIGAIAALALGSWWVLIGVLLVHLVASSLVIVYTMRRASADEGKPDPVTEARIEEEEVEGKASTGRRDREVFT